MLSCSAQEKAANTGSLSLRRDVQSPGAQTRAPLHVQCQHKRTLPLVISRSFEPSTLMYVALQARWAWRRCTETNIPGAPAARSA